MCEVTRARESQKNSTAWDLFNSFRAGDANQDCTRISHVTYQGVGNGPSWHQSRRKVLKAEVAQEVAIISFRIKVVTYCNTNCKHVHEMMMISRGTVVPLK